MSTTETEFTALLDEALFEANDAAGETVFETWSFESAGLMTRNEGLVVRLADGSEFQVTVVRSR